MRTRPLGKFGVTTTVTLALTASLLAVATLPVESDAQPAASTASTASSTGPAARLSACANVLVVGVDGNGQRPARGDIFGRTVQAFASKYERQLSAGRSVRMKRVGLRTPGLGALTAGHRSGKTAVSSVRPSSLRHWAAPVRPGTTKLMKTLDAAAAKCPEQQFVLVGYAQGAKVVHLALTKAAKRTYASRLAAGVLISDPSRRGGIEARLGKRAAASLSPTPTFGVWGVCSRGDLVCAPGKSRLGPAVTKAQSYRGAAPAMVKARTGALDRARRWPAPDPAVQISAALVSEPISLPLAADVTSAARAGAQWTPTGTLPAGLTLSPNGVLSGTVETSGQWTVDYAVVGTSPTTTPHSGRVILTVGEGATSVSAGGQVSCTTDGGGIATCRGANQFGQLGDGTTTGRSTPAPVKGTGWESISTSGATTCGIKTGGTLWCWGLNNFAQLGNNTSSPRTKPQQVAPSLVWKQVATSWFNTCAIDSTGALYCWGQNLRGAAGVGKTSRLVATPQLIGSASDRWTNVSSGGWHTCAVRGDGSMWCWGQNSFGQVGTGKDGIQAAPAQVGTGSNWREVSTSWGHTCGVTTTGELWCWGLNKDGQIGVGTRDDAWAPQQVAPGTVWTAVAAGDANTCALDSGGQAWCWGGNRYSQLGAGPGASSIVPAQATAVPPLTAITAGWLHGCGLSGSVPTCWGNNEAGQVGAVTARSRAAAPTVSSTDQARQRDAVRQGRAALRLSTAAQIRREIGDRPKVSAAARKKKDPFTTKVMTFNLLGSQHTTVAGTRPDWAPGRVRSEWASSLIEARGGSIIGVQEIQPDQVVSLDVATDDKYDIWPGTSMGYAGAPQSVMWRKSEWKAVWKDTITIPFMRNQPRPQPIVRLRHKATGREVYVINAHFSPGKMEDDRRKATALVIKAIKTLKKDGLPILLTGDFNDHNRVFCQVTAKTPLRAALGGSNKKTCKPPAARRVDWIFGSGGSFGKLSISQGAQVRRTTDHAVQDVSFSVQ
jgi:alpha-tubulin suppressor-like RCC1 family protein/endonuclease/exonuclease/phosphatase family metal-dependent hydrolase